MVQQIILVSAVILLFLTGLFLGSRGKDQLKRELETAKSRLSSTEALNKELKRLLYGSRKTVSRT